MTALESKTLSFTEDDVNEVKNYALGQLYEYLDLMIAEVNTLALQKCLHPLSYKKLWYPSEEDLYTRVETLKENVQLCRDFIERMP
jgi:hypothetical protein